MPIQSGSTGKSCCSSSSSISCCCRVEMNGSRLFVVQVVLIWCVLCLPGNLVTLILQYRLAAQQQLTDVNDTNHDLLASRPQFGGLNQSQNQIEAVDEERLEACLCHQGIGFNSNLTSTGLVLLDNNRSFGFNHCYSDVDDLTPECFDLLTSLFPNVTFKHADCHELQTEYDTFLDLTKFWVEGVAIIIVGLFGLCGNMITIAVLRKTETNRNFNKLLMSLAIVDSLLIIMLIGETSIIHTLMEKEPTWYVISYPYFLHAIKGMIQTSTIFMVVAVSAERYKAVCHPLSHRQAPFKFILLVVFISIGLETPRFFQFRVVHINNETIDFWTTDMMEDPLYIQFSSYWDEIITTGLVPLLALVFFNLRMILKIRASGKFSHRFVGRSTTGPETTHYRSEIEMEHSTMISRGPRMTHTESSSFIEASPRNRSFRCYFYKRHDLDEGDKIAEDDENAPEDQGDQPETIALASSKSNSPTAIVVTNGNGLLAPAPPDNHKKRSSCPSKNHFQKRREKSTIILVLIVVIFIACHSYRLSLKFYEFANPDLNTAEHFQRCLKEGRFHIPVVFYVLVSIHHLLLAINSSINFIIYCCVGKEFRSKVINLCRCRTPDTLSTIMGRSAC